MEENAVQIAKIAAPVYLTIGLSVLLYAKAWNTLLDKWRKDHLSLFPLMVLYPVLGLIIINMYNVWEWNVWLLVTLIGWILLVKGVLYFILPGSVIKSMMNMKKNPALIYLGGIAALVMGAVLGYYSYFA
jgi:hypothetical protein